MPVASDQTPEVVQLTDWGSFELAMLQDAAYQRVADRTANQRAVSRIELYFSTAMENWPVAAMLWHQMLSGCIPELAPTAEEAAAWSAIAQATNMPIFFNEQGYLKPIELE